MSAAIADRDQPRPPLSPGAPGVIVYPKPPGVTSHDVVARVRGRIRDQLDTAAARGRRPRVKVGHAGTLDPFATGLLLVLVGGATRAQRWLMALPKTYRVVARLGWRSDSGDRDGELVQTRRVPDRIEIPVGEIEQRPPAYSAVRVGGTRLYERAHRGDPTEGEPRRVTVHRADLLWRDADRAGFEIECSSGTYVRQLVAALGDAYCEQLERTRIGHFALADADPERLVDLSEALAFLPERPLAAAEAERVAHGAAVADEAAVGWAGGAGSVVRLTREGRLIAIAEPRAGTLQPVVVLAP